MRFILIIAMGFCILGTTSCGGPSASKTAETLAAPATPATPPEIASAAQALLGSDAEVLAYGDLAKTGKQQVLVINRLPKTPPGVSPGILFTRAVIAENGDGRWKELFRCDEYLKNQRGFLGMTPLDPVSFWRLQYEQDAVKGLQLYFTPVQLDSTSHFAAIGVRWNPATKRYQSLDRSYEHFLVELPALEKIRTHLR